ncbi:MULTISPECIES: ATP-binding protein [Bacillus]|nr:DUF87 domain-containing protein [Bacillus pseudomycoides]
MKKKMAYERLFNIEEEESIGSVNKVDSYSVTVSVVDEGNLQRINVNGFVIIHTSNANVRLIGRIDRVLSSEANFEPLDDDEDEYVVFHDNVVHINALGTLKGPGGGRERATFSRAVETLPEIGAKCFLLIGERLSAFTGLIADETTSVENPLTLGTYTMAQDANAILDGDAFFQRHAMIVGSTGSGKSWTTAQIIEQVAMLNSSNMVVFDLHGEYSPLSGHPNIKFLKIVGPGDLQSSDENLLYLPYWLLGYEDMLALILDRSDENAPNQSMAFSNTVIEAKKQVLQEEGMEEELATFTIDSPVAYRINDVISKLKELNTQKVTGANNREVNGPFHGKFNRFIPRLESKISDRRYGFLFNLRDNQLSSNYLDQLVDKLMKPTGQGNEGVKIIDFSEVPSDILPIVISLVARLIFQIQQWSIYEERHPIALVCDEAHLYIPSRNLADAAGIRALAHFERIAKEGRKYGLSLIIVSQRPSELNTTIMSQCSNVIALRLANQADKNAVCNLLPENLGGIQDILPTLGIGEGLVVGDACLLPSRIKIREPHLKPNSESVRFWRTWNESVVTQNLNNALNNFRRQTISSRVNV